MISHSVKKKKQQKFLVALLPPFEGRISPSSGIMCIEYYFCIVEFSSLFSPALARANRVRWRALRFSTQEVVLSCLQTQPALAVRAHLRPNLNPSDVMTTLL